MSDEFENMTVAQLKDVLRDRGLPVSGKKAELIARLMEESEKPPVEDAPAIEEDDYEDDFDDEDDFFEEEDDWDDLHTARQKPVLDEETSDALKFRASQKKKQPAFRRQEWYRYRRLARSSWRKPKGMHSSMRLNRKYRPPMARIGYRKITSARDLHPSGFQEVLVHKASDLEGLDPERQAIRIGATVGNRKRINIHERANDLGLRVLNRRRIERRGDL
ncbi:50S ribosomal protein L32e [Euryarchaeota archaeon]|nr:50S ribosomal protein L32e [Euryarchaeota archaeon]|tara:strand:- start:4840 stop:5496 length:657 start_codon:yes stop_codon:yes gene_type:complete